MPKKFHEIKVAPELESMVVDLITGLSDGINIQARNEDGSFVLGWPDAKIKSGYLGFEPNAAVVELALPPSPSPAEIRKSVENGYAFLDKHLRPAGWGAGAVSHIGPNDEPIFEDNLPRYALNKLWFGEEGWRMQGHQVSQHRNVNLPTREEIGDEKKFEREVVRRFNLSIGFAPVLNAITASSKFYQGKAYGESHRTELLRDIAYAHFQEAVTLPNYITSVAEHQEWISEITDKKIERMKVVAEAAERKDLIEEIDLAYERQKTGGVVRIRGEDESYRLEDRGDDLPDIDTIVGACTLEMGLLRQDIPVYPGAMSNQFYDGTSFRPLAIATLRGFRNQLPGMGINHPELKAYALQVLRAAQNGLSREEQHELEPIEEIIHTGKTLSKRLENEALELGYDTTNLTAEQGGVLALRSREYTGAAVQPQKNKLQYVA